MQFIYQYNLSIIHQKLFEQQVKRHNRDRLIWNQYGYVCNVRYPENPPGLGHSRGLTLKVEI